MTGGHFHQPGQPDRPEIITAFEIVVDATYYLTVDELWPDGDAPENPTAHDVAELMRSSGSQRSVMADWNIDEPEVTVRAVNGDLDNEVVW